MIKKSEEIKRILMEPVIGLLLLIMTEKKKKKEFSFSEF